MATNLFQRLAINEDVDAEFHFWKTQFVFSAWTAVAFAVATGFAIAAWPAGVGDAEMRAFARDFWTLLAECMFWLGFLLGLMWAGAKRFGCALSGTLPWQTVRQLGTQLARARLLGQLAACSFLLAVGFWLTGRFAAIADASIAGALPVLQAMTTAGFAGAALCAVAALTEGKRAHSRH